MSLWTSKTQTLEISCCSKHLFFANVLLNAKCLGHHVIVEGRFYRNQNFTKILGKFFPYQIFPIEFPLPKLIGEVGKSTKDNSTGAQCVTWQIEIE